MTHCRNLISDIPGLSVGNAHDAFGFSGVTVLILDRPVIAAVDVRGGGPGTRETEALGLAGTVEHVHAIVLSGGSAFGLSAATGVQTYLAARGIGFPVGSARVPIVPQAILFDLANGGDKGWITGQTQANPYERLAGEACVSAGADFALGSAGAGFGATTVNLRGGLGSASQQLSGGLLIAALAAVNAAGSATVGRSAHFWAAPFEHTGEFGGHGMASPLPADALLPKLKGTVAANTTLAIVATNARLTRPQAHRLAVMAQTGMARALYPVHTPLDGDVVFALATGDVPLADPVFDLARLGAHAANVLARAIARGVYDAAPCPQGWLGPPDYRSTYGGKS
jgi:D-aminopeptidase